MTFTLTIETGNDAMQTDGDIGRALSALGHKFKIGTDGPDIRDGGKIMDLNGNSVGRWEMSK